MCPVNLARVVGLALVAALFLVGFQMVASVLLVVLTLASLIFHPRVKVQPVCPTPAQERRRLARIARHDMKALHTRLTPDYVKRRNHQHIDGGGFIVAVGLAGFIVALITG